MELSPGHLERENGTKVLLGLKQRLQVFPTQVITQAVRVSPLTKENNAEERKEGKMGSFVEHTYSSWRKKTRSLGRALRNSEGSGQQC